MWTDPIVDELHKIRQANAEKFNYDLDALFEHLKRQEKRSKRKIVTLPIKKRPMMQETAATQSKRQFARPRPVLTAAA